jgi:hypothetical protein
MMNLHPRFLFPGQQENERIYLVTRPHWIVLAKRFLLWFIFVVVLLGLDYYILPTYPALSQSPFSQILALIRSIYIMGLVLSAFTLWVIYYLNYQIITNERVVDITQNNLLHHTTSELNLARLQDVTAEIHGILGTFFNFGNVYIQTAGEVERFEFENIPNPNAVAKLVLDLYEKLPRHDQASLKTDV